MNILVAKECFLSLFEQLNEKRKKESRQIERKETVWQTKRPKVSNLITSCLKYASGRSLQHAMAEIKKKRQSINAIHLNKRTHAHSNSCTRILAYLVCCYCGLCRSHLPKCGCFSMEDGNFCVRTRARAHTHSVRKRQPSNERGENVSCIWKSPCTRNMRLCYVWTVYICMRIGMECAFFGVSVYT